MAALSDAFRSETATVAPEKNEGIPQNAWMVRPCEWYSEEHADCKGIRGKFHQYFVHGTTLDCSQWQKDYENCMLWRNKKDLNALKAVVESEEKRKHDRLKASYDNDVWELRSKPPENWNAPLPDWLNKKFENSYLGLSTKQQLEKKSSCCIS
ncbi:synaptic plasticity regulator PANTS [Amblyomma americanum]|uniref:Synaptic plasticity regulator PANTS n=2 Tax=Amblyomma americanum TaxID=6943 RepID=A0AAQ4FFK3_AMBAM